MIPALIRKMVESPDEIVLWGDGTPTREYLYVDDCVEGLLLAAERYDGAEPGQPRHRASRRRSRRPPRSSPRPSGSPARSAGTRRCRTASRGARSTRRAAAELFGFRAQVPLEEGIRRTVAWYPRTATEPLRPPDRLLVVTVGAQWAVTVRRWRSLRSRTGLALRRHCGRQCLDRSRRTASRTVRWPPTGGPLVRIAARADHRS